MKEMHLNETLFATLLAFKGYRKQQYVINNVSTVSLLAVSLFQSHDEDLEKEKASQNCIERGVEHGAKRSVMAHAEVPKCIDELQEEKEQSNSSKLWF